ncbi:hypothetical protein [Streptomyces venezuelae]|uniref:hypothetical protein n=1 Tax=Streptomyces venezuelae TaxID=54571 RepID=UPI00123C31E5|nr:hypothetical protein [Streptomyces venezuelae]
MTRPHPAVPGPGTEPGRGTEPGPAAEPGAAPASPTGLEVPWRGTIAQGFAPTPAGPRRGGGDPVKALMRRHRELCERAVDPLEIAAGLEALGVTDRTAARFRHRDVFSLAEEIYARVPRTTAPAEERAEQRDRRVLRGCAYALVPGGLVWALAAAVPAGPVAAALTGLVLAAALVRPSRPPRGTAAAHLIAAVGLGWAVHRHGPAIGLALALAVVPAHAAVLGHAAQARRRLAASRTLAEFTAMARPLPLLAATAATALALPLLAATGTTGPALPLVPLLFLARLLLAHGVRHPVTAALALGLLPVPGAALAGTGWLLVHATIALSRASAHTRSHDREKEKDMTGQPTNQGAAQ